MDKSGLAQRIADKHGIYKAEAKEMVDMVIDGIVDGMRIDGELILVNFCTLKVKHVEERMGHDPRNNLPLLIPAHDRVVFRASKFLNNAIGTEE